MPAQFTGTDFDLNEVIDLDTYPIHDLSSPVRSDIVTQTRRQMDAVGCCRISDFLRPAAVEAMRSEAVALHHQAHWAFMDHNPYASPDDPSFPEAHPRRFFQHRTSGFINSDLLLADSALRKIYDHDAVVHFVWDCLGLSAPIYRWADPLGRNPYGVMEPDHYFPWHFDGNEFTVSLLVQKADSGGVFEYVPSIRQPHQENYEHVQHILEGGRDGVHELDLLPGDFQIFKGRYSLHRVTRIEGASTRYIGLPTYVHDPFRMNSPHHAKTFYGRATELHHTRLRELADGLVD